MKKVLQASVERIVFRPLITLFAFIIFHRLVDSTVRAMFYRPIYTSGVNFEI
jgi:hypothetical protein